MTDAHIRAVRPADSPAVLRLIRGLAAYEQTLHEITITETQLREALFGARPRIHGILAELNRGAVGFALFYYTFITSKARSVIFLEDLFVEPEQRGTGVGLGLMRHLARLAVTENCARIEWRVLNWNLPSIEFYRRLGAVAVKDCHTLLLVGEGLSSLAEGKLDG